MSEKNQEPKRTVRERMQQEREREKAQEKRRRLLVVSAGVVGVLGLAAVVGVVAANADKGDKGGKSGNNTAGPLLAPAGAEGKEQLAIRVGATDAPSTLTVWEDFRCPVCAQFENVMRDAVQDLEKSGDLKVEYHFATIIDGNMGGSGSLRAANAVACAQDVGKFAPYHDVLYRNQPPEPDDAFADNDKLLDLAKKVDGLDTPGFRSCVQDGTHDSWVAKSNEAFAEGRFQGTPTVLLNGESIFPTKDGKQISPENLKKWVTEANKGKEPGKETGSAEPGGSESGAGTDTGRSSEPGPATS
ncbi:thioredoxin domain-containing protein [Streptomyces sp. NPDC048057]|uniref:DsbA family protein n=1 Tax=Streptomyces sp. NPDC048057 TaxID=3155628 RepID=UPI0033C3EF08